MTIWILLFVVAVVGFALYNLNKTTDAPAVIASSPPVPDRFIVFDIETTGLDPTTHEIIEIGAIRVNRDATTHDTLHAFVRPSQKVPERITQLTGITQEVLDKEGEALDEVMNQFLDFFGELPLVAYNAEFDVSFLRKALEQVKSPRPFRNQTICALLMARKAWPERKSFRLADLSKDGNLDLSNTHRALADCRRTMIVYGAAARVLGHGTN